MNKKEIFVKDIKLEQKINNEPFSLRQFEIKQSRAGKNYYNVQFGDKTGEIRGKIWGDNLENIDENLKIGDIVYVSGVVQEYNGNPQLIADSVRLAVDFPHDEFLESTARDRISMQKDLDEAFVSIKDPYLKELADKIWNGELKERLLNFPAAEYVHHGYVGGLLEHMWEMWQLAQGFLKIHEKLDRDLILIGILTHDVGKIEELEITGTSIERTLKGKLIAHLAIGLVFTEKKISEIAGFPDLLRAKVLHIIISHNGSVEYGSPVNPQTLEALVIYFIDKSSADLNMAVGQINKDLSLKTPFSGYNKWLKASMLQSDYL